jgi:hypothetical protein
MLEVPEELNGMIPSLRELLHTALTQVERSRTGGAVDYAAFERLIAEKAAEVERRAHEVALTALDLDLPRVMVNGVLHARVLRKPTTFMALAGPVQVERTLYRPVGRGNAPAVDLVALRAGAMEGVWLPATAREMAFAVQQCTPREAAVSGRRLGRLPYSFSAFQFVAHVVGEKYVGQHQHVEQALIEKFVVPPSARNVSVSLDRVSIPMEEPSSRAVTAKGPKRPINRVFRMAFCGTVTLHDDDGEAIHTIRYGTMPDGDPEALCMGMADDAAGMLAQRPDLKLILLCDGAKEMWTRLDAQFSSAPFDKQKFVATRLIDFWHVIEKLAPAARVVAGEGDTGALLGRWKLHLRNSSAARAAILAELSASHREFVRVGDTQPVHEAITYLTNNADRMDYAAARRAGFPIGSGAVEATCKSLVNIRMKRPGSRWKTRTGEHIIQLRALALSDRWDPAIDLVITRPRVTIRGVAA